MLHGVISHKKISFGVKRNLGAPCPLVVDFYVFSSSESHEMARKFILQFFNFLAPPQTLPRKFNDIVTVQINLNMSNNKSPVPLCSPDTTIVV